MNREEIIAALSGRKERAEEIDLWIELLKRDMSLTEVFTDEGTSSVALYEPERNAADAEIFIHELNLRGIPIDCIVSEDPAGRMIGEKFGIVCVPHEEISERVRADFIVILSSNDYARRRIELLRKTSAEVISLNGLLDLMRAKWTVAAIASKVPESCCFKMCLLEWPKAVSFNDVDLHKKLGNIAFAPGEYQKNPERFQPLYNDIEEYSNDYIREIFQERPVVWRGGNIEHADCTGKFVNIVGGHRLTVGQPDDADCGVYLGGGCMAYGIGTDDRYTIASFLQQRINDHYGSVRRSRCAVYNLGAWGVGMDEFSQVTFMSRDRKKEKIWIFVFRADFTHPKGGNGKIHRYLKKNAERCGFQYIDLTDTLYKVEKEEGTYLDSTHTNHRGYRAVAGKVWNDFLKPLFESGALSAGNESPDTPSLYPKIVETFANSKAHICICFWPGASDLGLPPSADLSRISKGFASETQERNFTYLGTYLYNEIPAFSKAYLSEIVRENTDAALLKNPDRKGVAVNITNGTRQTIGQPADAKRRVHLFGSGIAFGIGTEDRYTIPSFLQEQLNLHANKTASDPIRVENEGVCQNRVDDVEILEQTIAPKLRNGEIKDDDIVIWLIDKRYSSSESDKKSFAHLTAYLKEHGIEALDLTQALYAAQKKGTYIDKKHVNQRGNKVVATKLYMDYVKRIVEGDIPTPLRHPQTPLEDLGKEDLTGEQNAEFKEYLSYLESERNDSLAPNAKIGAIVMNCNPFTKGHRYLVERASAEVDLLYVFVVEEDKSFFPFADRFKLVSEGLSDLKNVRVLRSGKFIISTITFPGYFTKDSAKEVAVDTSLDLRLFCKFIVPALGIGTRFAGTEPTDMVTRQYNHAMKETLPQYGVEFVEFERTANEDTVISASTVRARLEERNWDAIRELVPDVTYRYLRDRFGE